MTYDSIVRVAWAERPTGPLSNLYLTTEQTDAVFDWLDDVIARVREDERPDPESAEADAYDHGYAAALRDAVEAVKAVYTPQEGTYIGLCIHGDAVAAIEALGGES